MEQDDLTPLGPDPHHLLGTGTTLGRYFLLRRIGSGGMGAVYEAFDPQLDRKVALKVLHAPPGDVDDVSSGQTRLVREAQALAKLSHPNVVQVHDVGSADGRVFVAMELVDGETAASWLARARRSWREVLDVFLPAGRGLAAAHAAGVIHRDVKPANVLLGRDGRVRVVDFGLATWGDLRPRQPRAPGEEGPQRASDDRTLPLDSALTADGMVVGTPAYIAPELYAGGEADARADEFSFCVSLYQGLYGETPFAGATLAETASAALRGSVREPAPGSRVPPWVRHILLRGLRPDPRERYPSLTALLDDLANDRTARRRRWLVGGAAAAGAAAAAVLAGRARVSPCGSGSERIAEAWGPGPKARVEAALLATGKPYAPTAFAAVERTVDAWTAGWTRMYRDACEATHVRHEQSAELLDLRMQCLAARRRDLEGLTALLALGGPDVADRAPAAAAALPPLDECANAAALTAPVRPPSDPAVRSEVDRLRFQLAEARALWTTARYPEGLEKARSVAGSPAARAYPPLLADALLLRSFLEESSGDAAASEATLHEALEAATRGRHDVAAARAYTALLWVVGERQLRFEEAHRYGRLARASLDRLGAGGDELEADLLSHLGTVESNEGRHEEGLRDELAALALYEKLLGAKHPNVHRALNRVGNAYYGLGKLDEALAYFQRALDGTVEALGPEHPTVAVRLGNLAIVHEERGEKEKALELHRRAMAIEEKALGPEHPQLALSHSNVGLLLLSMGRKEEALAHARRAVEIQERVLGPQHPDVGVSLINLADTLRQSGKLEEALAAGRRASAVLERSLGPGHEWLLHALVGQGRILLELHRPADAVAPLSRAAALDEKTHKTPQAGFLLARALTESGGDRGRARSLAEGALVRARDAKQADLAAEVGAWLARR